MFRGLKLAEPFMENEVRERMGKNISPGNMLVISGNIWRSKKI